MGSLSENEGMNSSDLEESLLSKPETKGGVKTLPFIIVNESFEKLASVGLQSNMILYLTRVYGLDNTGASNILFLYSAAANFTPIIGAFIADSLVGRYRTIGFGSIVTLLGMILLWFTTIISPATSCDPIAHTCISPSTPQLLVLYCAFALMAIGAGGVRPCSLAFGADQINKRDMIQDADLMDSFMTWYYATCTLPVIIGPTVMVYIQDNVGWKVGFGIPVILMFISAMSFFLASPCYVKVESKKNLFSSLVQVIVASYRNRRHPLPSNPEHHLYHSEKDPLHLIPSEKLRFLNKACIIRNPSQDVSPDGRASNPWNLCTVDQVEDLKSLLKIVPMWTTGIMVALNINQSSFLVLEAQTMDRHVGSHFEIHAGSFGAFMVTCVVVWLALYEFVVVPLVSKIRGRPTRLNAKQKMGYGIIFSCVSISTIAIIEGIRRKLANDSSARYPDQQGTVVNMSALWLLPRLALDGLTEAFSAVGQNEFYLTELPQSMSSFASCLFGFGMSPANLVGSMIVSTVDSVTKGKEGHSWLSNDINKGHYDYYYWLIGGLCFVNFLYFLFCSKAYGPCKGNKGNTDLGQVASHSS